MIYHVHTHAYGGWASRREGSVRGRRFSTKGQATRYTRTVVGWKEIVIHRTDGTVLGIEYPKVIPPPPPPTPRLTRDTLAGRMVKRFAK